MLDPTKITGYRVLNAEEVAHINAVKEMGAGLDDMLNDLNNQAHYDRRWLAIAKTHLQEGIMAAMRAIARPEGF